MFVFYRSILFRFINVTTPLEDSDISGLWSTRASDNSSANLRNYREHSRDYILDGNDVFFCPNFQTVVCPVNACLSTGQEFRLNWDAPATCDALGDTIHFVCRWAGGLVTEPASYDIQTKQLACNMPSLPGIPYNSIVAVEVDIVTSGNASKVSGIYLGMYSVTNTPSGFDNSQIMVRYVQFPESCGCSALSAYNGLSWYELLYLH